MDRNPKRIPVKHNLMTPHQMEKSLLSLQHLIDGKKWPEIAAAGGYNWRDFAWLMAKFPDLAKAYKDARATSAQTLEDRALELAEQLVAPNEFTGTQVRAHEVAMGQFRWSAARRDPAGFAESGSKGAGTMVPVQIITSLNLGQGGEQQQAAKSVWEVHAAVSSGLMAQTDKEAQGEEVEVEGEIVPGEGPDTLSEAPLPEDPILKAIADAGLEVAFDIPARTTADTLPADLDALRVKLDMPSDLPAAIKRRPAPGARPKGHKTAAGTGATRARYASMKKSASVKAALGIKDDE